MGMFVCQKNTCIPDEWQEMMAGVRDCQQTIKKRFEQQGILDQFLTMTSFSTIIFFAICVIRQLATDNGKSLLQGHQDDIDTDINYFDAYF